MRTITKLLLAIVIFAIGWATGLFAENWSWFVFTNEVSLLDVISIVITTAIGLYVADVIQKNLESKRVEKDIIFGLFNYVEAYLSELGIEVSKNQEGGDSVVLLAKIGSCRKFWNKILKMMNDKYNIQFSTGSDYSKEFIQLNRLCTSTPKKGANDTSIRITNGKIFYSDIRKNKIYSEIDRIRMVIVDLKLLINQKS